MKIAIPAEIHDGEKRVAASPEVVDKLIKAGFDVIVESGAGAGASFSDDVFREVGAEIAGDTASLWAAGELFLKVRPPQHNDALGRHEIEMMPPAPKVWVGRRSEKSSSSKVPPTP